MEPFATTAQMAERSKGAIPEDRPFLFEAIAAASAEIRKTCRWHVAGVETITQVHRGAYVGDVWLSAMQISEVTAVVIDGVTWPDPSVVEFDPDTGWTNLRGRIVAVTYKAGFNSVPDDIVDLTLQIAGRALGSPLGAVREQVLGASVQWTTTAAGVAGGSVVLEHEKASLSEYVIGRLP